MARAMQQRLVRPLRVKGRAARTKAKARAKEDEETEFLDKTDGKAMAVLAKEVMRGKVAARVATKAVARASLASATDAAVTATAFSTAESSWRWWRRTTIRKTKLREGMSKYRKRKTKMEQTLRGCTVYRKVEEVGEWSGGRNKD